MSNPKAIDKFIDFYRNFSVDDRRQFDIVYDRKIIFQDPFHKISGRDNLFQYFEKMMNNILECRFEIHETVFNSLEKNDTAIVTWDMYFKHSRLNGRKEIFVNGATHLKYTEKIVFHRDYFDSSQLLYKHLPLLGSIIRLLERNV